MAFAPRLRVLELQIERFRNLHNLSLSISPETSLVCLVGENGTGKTTVLELLGQLAARLGLARGYESSRGETQQEAGSWWARVQVTESVEELRESLGEPDHASLDAWDGCLELRAGGEITARVGETDDAQFAAVIHGVIQSTREVHYLVLDADRSYPPTAVQPQEYGQLLQRSWQAAEDRLASAFRMSRTLYGEWMQYMVATEGQTATRFQQQHRRALASGEDPPTFTDPFSAYGSSLREVLPHLHFSTVDISRFMPLFDSSGTELKFSSLSGGEREIAFLIGQIHRFQLKRGLLLVDEPELHLNPDLVRRWISFLRDSIEDGQVWIATHSLEAVEAAGAEASFLFERDSTSREVGAVSQLSTRPVVLALSGALGTPAFSPARERYVFVEGERRLAERERFYRLCGTEGVRFIEGGGCRAVLAKQRTIRELGEESSSPLRVGAVIDRDHRDQSAVTVLEAHGAHVLGVHEVENLFLHPPVLDHALRANDRTESAHSVLRRGADLHAGRWVYARAVQIVWGEGAIQPAWVDERTLRVAASVVWTALSADRGAFAGQHRTLTAAEGDDSDRFEEEVRRGIEVYEAVREDEHALWKAVSGKQLLRWLPREVGFSDLNALERNVVTAWADRGVSVPPELTALRDYISDLEPSNTH